MEKHCENDYTTQSNLQTQCYPYQTTNVIFHSTGTKKFMIWKNKRPPNSQSNLKKTRAGEINLADFRLYYKAIAIKSMVPAQKQKYKPMGQESKPRETHIPMGTLFLTKETIQWRKDSLFNKQCWENWTATYKTMKRTLSTTIHKNKFEMD